MYFSWLRTCFKPNTGLPIYGAPSPGLESSANDATTIGIAGTGRLKNYVLRMRFLLVNSCFSILELVGIIFDENM